LLAQAGAREQPALVTRPQRDVRDADGLRAKRQQRGGTQPSPRGLEKRSGGQIKMEFSSGGALGGDLPLVQKQEPIGEAGRQVQMVRDQEHRDAAVRLAPQELDESVSRTAHMFQAQVDKAEDWRATVVGDQVFCVRIDSHGGPLDWRENYAGLSYCVVVPPPEFVDAVRRFLARFDLSFGCFDFAVAKDGTPYFLELNPNGQWSWIDETRADITTALADLLQKGLD
jgi:hypothetical protein